MNIDEITEGLKLRQIQRMTGGIYDKQKLNLSKIDIASAFNSDNLKKENLNEMGGENEELEKILYADKMKGNSYFHKFAQKHQQKLEIVLDQILAKPDNQILAKNQKLSQCQFRKRKIEFLETYKTQRAISKWW
eukprot:403366802